MQAEMLVLRIQVPNSGSEASDLSDGRLPDAHLRAMT
jgi:hypothetical protein